MMTKIVINRCYGGFSLSQEAINRYAAIKGVPTDSFYDREIERHDPALVQVVEELGEEADGPRAHLRVEEIPSGARYRIDEYDGMESVETPDSYDWSVAP